MALSAKDKNFQLMTDLQNVYEGCAYAAVHGQNKWPATHCQYSCPWPLLPALSIPNEPGSLQPIAHGHLDLHGDATRSKRKPTPDHDMCHQLMRLH